MNFKNNFGGFGDRDIFGQNFFPNSLSNRFNNDPFLSRQINFDRFFGDFSEDLGNNSNLDTFSDGFFNNDIFNSRFRNMPEISNIPGSQFVSKSYSSTVSYNGSGEPVREVFQSESYNTVDEKGKKIGEKKIAYENTGIGIQKAAHEKHLDDKAYKIVKEKQLNSGDEIESNYYKGIHEQDLNNFNSEFIRQKEQIKLGRLGVDNRYGTNHYNNENNNDTRYLGSESQSNNQTNFSNNSYDNKYNNNQDKYNQNKKRE